MREYRPAGFLARTAWQRFRLKTSNGYRGWARRIWLGNIPPEADGILLVDCIVEEMLCLKDTQGSTAYILRSSEATNALARHGMEVLDRPSHSEATIEWQRSGLTFRSVLFDQGPYHCEVMELARSQSALWQAESISKSIRSSIAVDSEKSKFCIYSLWRSAWGLLDAWPVIVVVFAINAILSVLLPGLLTLLIFILSLVLIVWAYTSWSSMRHYRERVQANSKIVAQGDEDGSVRRALASIGVQLPPVPGE
jgi:hypothetical protein